MSNIVSAHANIIEMDEAQFVSRCISGDEDARNKLYESFFKTDTPVYFWVYNNAYWIPSGDKEDMLNDIFLAVLESLPSFEFKSSLKTYVVRIAKFKCLDAMPSRLGYSKGKGIRFVDTDQRDENGELEYQIEDPAATRQVDRLFENLDERERVYLLHTVLARFTGPRCQEALRLYLKELNEELSRGQVADKLGVRPERAGHIIYDCLYRIRKRIYKTYRDYDHFSDCISTNEI